MTKSCAVAVSTEPTVFSANSVVGQSSLLWSPVTSANQNYHGNQGHVVSQGISGYIPPAAVGLTYPYYSYSYGQPFPALTGYSHSYSSLPYMSWGPLQFMSKYDMEKSSQSQVTMRYGYTGNLLDLSNKDSVKPTTTKSKPSSVGVAHPLRRTHSQERKEKSTNYQPKASGQQGVSSINKDPVVLTIPKSITAPQAVSVSVTSESVPSSNGVSGPRLTADGRASLLALEHLTKSFENTFQHSNLNTQIPDSTNTAVSEAFQSSENINVKPFTTQPLTAVLARPRYSQTENTAFQISSSQMNLFDGIEKESSPVSNADTKPDTLVTVTQSGVSNKSFPYKQHVPLPDGSCPLVEFAKVSKPAEFRDANTDTVNQTISTGINTYTWKDGIAPSQLKLTSDTGKLYKYATDDLKFAPEKITNKVYGACIKKGFESETRAEDAGENMKPVEHKLPLNLAVNDLQVTVANTDEQTKASGVAAVGVKMSKESRLRQVKIKLDKQSGGHFLTELMKLTATYSAPVSSGTKTRCQSTPAYRAPVISQSANILKANPVAGWKLNNTNRKARQNGVVTTEQPQRKRLCSMPSLQQAMACTTASLNTAQLDDVINAVEFFEGPITAIDGDDVPTTEAACNHNEAGKGPPKAKEVRSSGEFRCELPDLTSRSSSTASLSPYLLGLLPDRLEEESTDDEVFME